MHSFLSIPSNIRSKSKLRKKDQFIVLPLRRIRCFLQNACRLVVRVPEKKGNRGNNPGMKQKKSQTHTHHEACKNEASIWNRMNDIFACTMRMERVIKVYLFSKIKIISKDIVSISIEERKKSCGAFVPCIIIILSLTFVSPAVSCYKGVCHFMRSHFLFLLSIWIKRQNEIRLDEEPYEIAGMRAHIDSKSEPNTSPEWLKTTRRCETP